MHMLESLHTESRQALFASEAARCEETATPLPHVCKILSAHSC